MDPLLIVGCIGLVAAIVYPWAFSKLPAERWQILATIPVQKTSGTDWRGINFTYYGFLSATATAIGFSLFFVLLSSLGHPTFTILLIAVVLVGLASVAAKLIAFIVEKKRNTFTVSGAAFTGFIVMPVLVLGHNTLRPDAQAFNLIASMAALMISYTASESIGRLACISFGCCYGRPLSDFSPSLQRLFRPLSIRFQGKTKKIAYESGWEDIEVLPIQALTSTLFFLISLTGLYLFLKGFHVAAFVVTTTLSMGWRFGSEWLRADYRGEGRITIYQWLSLVTIGIAVALIIVFGSIPAMTPDAGFGLQTLWHPMVLLTIQLIWWGTFLYMGRSSVTGAQLSFHVHQEQI